MAKAEMIEIAILPIATPSAMIRLFISVSQIGGALPPRPIALGQDLRVVLEQVRAGQQRHRRAQHGRLVVGRGDEGHPDREGDDDHAQDETRWLRKVSEGPVLDHQ